MRTIQTALLCATLGLAGSAFAASHMEKGASAPMMAKDGMMTMDQCKEHMAMAKKDGMAKKDDAMMKKDAACADMMKKDGMMKSPMASEPMKK